MAFSRESKTLCHCFLVFKRAVDPDTIITVLYSEFLVMREERGRAIQKTLTTDQQLDMDFKCLERRVSADPSVFPRLVQVLLAEPALEGVGKATRG